MCQQLTEKGRAIERGNPMYFRSNWTDQEWRLKVTLVLSQVSGGKDVSSTEATESGTLGFRCRHGIIGLVDLIRMAFSKWVDGRRQGRKAWRQVEEELGKAEREVEDPGKGSRRAACDSI